MVEPKVVDAALSLLAQSVFFQAVITAALIKFVDTLGSLSNSPQLRDTRTLNFAKHFASSAVAANFVLILRWFAFGRPSTLETNVSEFWVFVPLFLCLNVIYMTIIMVRKVETQLENGGEITAAQRTEARIMLLTALMVVAVSDSFSESVRGALRVLLGVE